MANALAAEDSFDGGIGLAVTGALRAAVTPENGSLQRKPTERGLCPSRNLSSTFAGQWHRSLD